MKFINLFILLLLLLLVVRSCTTLKETNTSQIIEGEYYKEFKDKTNYLLTLKPDRTFIYLIKGGSVAHGGSKCEGNWSMSNNILLLKCYEENYPAQITSGYMNQRDYKLIILNKDKLKLGNIILKRK